MLLDTTVWRRVASNRFYLMSMLKWIASCHHNSGDARPELAHQMHSWQFSWCTILHHAAYKLSNLTIPDLFSRRFREGISFPNFVERSILKVPLSKLCAVSTFRGEEKGEKVQTGHKRTCENRSDSCDVCNVCRPNGIAWPPMRVSGLPWQDALEAVIAKRGLRDSQCHIAFRPIYCLPLLSVLGGGQKICYRRSPQRVQPLQWSLVHMETPATEIRHRLKIPSSLCNRCFPGPPRGLHCH